MNKKPSEKQIKAALGAAMHLSPTQVDVFAGLISSVQPWQSEFLAMLLDERAADKSRITFLETILDHHRNQGDKVQLEAGQAFAPLNLPGGYQMGEHRDIPGQYLVFRVVNEEPLTVVQHLSSEEAAIEAAYTLDKQNDAQRWRPMAETCPAQTMLLFACADWAHSVELGKPVPVQTGYRGLDGIRIFGANWRPTHWCYQPEGPLCSSAPDSEFR